jgi:hypothetical protein
VPQLAVDEQLFLAREDYTNEAKVDALHASFKTRFKLHVAPDYIQYLVVPDDDHIFELVNFLRKNYDPDDATLVTTAIMTIDCIIQDV